MKFYGYFRSSAAYRCRIAFNLKGVRSEFIPVHLRRDGGQQKKADYRALNPQGLVPTLVDGSLVLTQSIAIIEWLDETQDGPALLPNDPDLRAQVRAFSQAIACDIHPLQNLRTLQYLKNTLEQEQSAIDAWCRYWIAEGLSACEALLSRQPVQNRFCFGTSPGLADICLVPQVFSAMRFAVALDDMPRIRAVYAACQDLKAFAEAAPSQQPDFED